MRYSIERRGGLAGLNASCVLDSETLAPHDRNALERLFDDDEPLPADPGADRFIYRVTRHGEVGTTTRDVPESAMPPAVAGAVIDEI